MEALTFVAPGISDNEGGFPWLIKEGYTHYGCVLFSMCLYSLLLLLPLLPCFWTALCFSKSQLNTLYVWCSRKF